MTKDQQDEGLGDDEERGKEEEVVGRRKTGKLLVDAQFFVELLATRPEPTISFLQRQFRIQLSRSPPFPSSFSSSLFPTPTPQPLPALHGSHFIITFWSQISDLINRLSVGPYVTTRDVRYRTVSYQKNNTGPYRKKKQYSKKKNDTI